MQSFTCACGTDNMICSLVSALYTSPVNIHLPLSSEIKHRGESSVQGRLPLQVDCIHNLKMGSEANDAMFMVLRDGRGGKLRSRGRKSGSSHTSQTCTQGSQDQQSSSVFLPTSQQQQVEEKWTLCLRRELRDREPKNSRLSEWVQCLISWILH